MKRISPLKPLCIKWVVSLEGGFAGNMNCRVVHFLNCGVCDFHVTLVRGFFMFIVVS